ncbi:hypothetical protein HY642_06805, partial [Candidatus Woesearchaeota archaeon]|nr:hypothetical protein [Candidatus Woesearchaeota archaeon]
MGIERVFPEEAAYVVDRVFPQIPEALAQKKLREFFTASPHSIVWAFYSRGPFGIIAVRDGVASNPDGTINIARRYA